MIWKNKVKYAGKREVFIVLKLKHAVKGTRNFREQAMFYFQKHHMKKVTFDFFVQIRVMILGIKFVSVFSYKSYQTMILESQMLPR